jgi:CheY-like chemotaxis protein
MIEFKHVNCQPLQTTTSAAQTTGYIGARKRVLIVDDQASQRVVLSELLAPLGFTLTEADSGAACLAAVAANPPDILLMDIAMPGMDGWEVCRLLRERGYTDLPIIIISANVFDPTARQSESLYCNDFIAKPFMMKDLLAKLKLHLGIEWIAAPKTEPATAQTLRMIPPRATLAKLVELGDIGYVKGIVALLSDIENKNALYAPFCTELKTLVERFRLPEYSNRLKEWMHDDVDHV